MTTVDFHFPKKNFQDGESATPPLAKPNEMGVLVSTSKGAIFAISMSQHSAATCLHLLKEGGYIHDVTMVDRSGLPVDLVSLEPEVVQETATEDQPDSQAAATGPASTATAPTAAAEAPAVAPAQATDDSFLSLHHQLQQTSNLNELAALGDHIKVEGGEGREV